MSIASTGIPCSRTDCNVIFEDKLAYALKAIISVQAEKNAVKNVE